MQQDGHQPQSMPPMDPDMSITQGLPRSHPLGDGDTPKRPRACEACRGLKVRCDFEGDADICKRCAKAHRECVVTAPNRRRPKKTDTRVADLEKRIDDLTTTLEQQRRQSSLGKRMASDEGFNDDAFRNDHMEDFTVQPPQKRRRSSYRNGDDPSPLIANGVLSGLNGANQASGAFPTFPSLSADNLFFGNEYADIIDRGVLTAAMADQIYEHYTNNMAKHMPAVVFPTTMTAGILRKHKPLLFLAILAVASGQHYPDLQRILIREARKVLADHVICKAEKSLELIQVMQVMCLWHSSENQNDTMAFQLVQMASAMAVAMELGGSPLTGHLGMSFVNVFSRSGVDHTSTESRRAWASCFLLSGCNGMPLIRSNLVPWSPSLENTLQALEAAPDSSATDKTLCSWARLQHIMDAISAPAQAAVTSPNDSTDNELGQKMQSALKQAEDFAASLTDNDCCRFTDLHPRLWNY
jgi:hypothetical protein